MVQANAPSEGYTTDVPVTKSVLQKGTVEPVTVVELKRQRVEDYAKTLGLPKSEDYQLRDMLAAGQIPELVNVSGMLDSTDMSDLANVGAREKLMDRLVELSESNDPAPVAAAAVVEPAQSIPAVESPKTE